MVDYFKEARKARGQRDYLKAGDLYVMGGDNRAAIETYILGGHFALAARLYEKEQDYRNAARLYAQAESFEKAALLYVSAGEFRRAAEMFEKSGDLARASEMAQKAGDLGLAAAMAEKGGKKDRAAELYMKVQNYERAVAIYTQLMDLALEEKKAGGFMDSTITRIRKYASAAGALNAKLQKYDQAARCYEEAGMLSKAAECHSRSGRFERAADLFASAEDFANAGESYEKAGKFVKASEMLERAGDLVRAADLAEKGGKLDRAAALYSRTDQSQKAADLLFQIVIKGVEDKAGRMFLDSERLSLRKSAATAAALYARLNQPARAAWCFEQAENLPKAAEFYAQAKNAQKAGELYLQSGQPARAYEILTAAEGGVQKPEVLAEACFQLEKYGEAGDLFLIVNNQARAAECYEKAGNRYKAAVLFEEMNDSARAAGLYAALEEYKKAAPLYVKAGNFLEAAQMHIKAGEPELAMQAYKQAGERLALARMTAVSDPQAAISMIQEIPQTDLEYPAACGLLGELFAARGMHSLAVQKFTEALGNHELDSSNIETCYNLGLSYQKLGQPAEAIKVYERILLVDIGYRDVLDRLQKLRSGDVSGETSVVLEPPKVEAPKVEASKPDAATDTRPQEPVRLPSATGIHITQQEPTAWIGKKIREYEILEMLGRGGMGAVYRARHIYLNKERAIKLIESKISTADFENRFIREARILSDLHSPYLVQLFEFGVLENHQFFMVLELIQGESVKARIKRLGRIPLADSLRIIAEAAMGLKTAHEKGIIHRDISPDNIMLVPGENGKETTRVIDFGIAKPLSEETEGLTSVEMFLGKPEFASPEQCGFLQEGETIDARTDIYSLAVTLYCMLTGKLPFYSPTPQGYLVKHVSQIPKPPSEVMTPGEIPGAVDQLILRALARSRNDRQASMAEFIQEISSL